MQADHFIEPKDSLPPSDMEILIRTPLDAIRWSVRARGCLERVGCENLWDVASRADEEWLRVRNLGRKTLTEIREQLGSYLKRVAASVELMGGEREAASTTDRELAKWVGHPDPRKLPQSAWGRLVLDLQTANLGHEPIGEISAQVGVKWPGNRYYEPLAEFLKPELIELRSQTGLGKTKIRVIIQCALAIWAEEHGMANQAFAKRAERLRSIKAELKPESLKSAMEAAFILAGINEKERKVFGERYGLAGQQPRTLEEVGQGRGLTRERIRQIQDMAREKLVRPPDLRRILMEGLEHLESHFFERLRDSCLGLIEERPQSELLARLGGWEGLLVELLYENIDDWLNQRAERTPLGWLYGEASQEIITIATPALAAYLKRCGVPVPVIVASRETGLSENTVRVAALHGAGWLTDDFVAAQSLRLKEQRVLRVHGQTRDAGSPLLKRKSLPLLFHPDLPEESYSPSTFNHEVGCFPQLILRCGSEYVLRVTPAWEVAHPDVRPALPPNLFRARGEDGQVPGGQNLEEDSLYEFGFRLLKTRKLWRVRKLMEEVVKASQGQFAGTSIGTLLVSHRVQRFAPGLWGMKANVLTAADYELLLHSEDCELYVEARHAGADLSSFSMWNPEMEFRWCRWAREQPGCEAIYQSLLSIITPDDWSCPIPQREQWRKRQRENGRYRLAHPPRKALAQLPVGAGEFLAAVADVVGRGGTSWMDLNIVHGRTIDSHRSAPFLALLIALEVVRPVGHWQEFHPAMPTALGRFQHLCRLWCEGFPDGSQALIEWVRSAAKAYVRLGRVLGWVAPVELQSLLNVLGRTDLLEEENEVVT